MSTMPRSLLLGLFLLLAMPRGASSATLPVRDLELLVIVGASGNAEYARRFEQDAAAWQAICARARVACHTVGLESETEGQTDAQSLQQRIEKQVSAGNKPLWIVLIGHGTFDGREAKFNLRGPDISVDDFATWLKPFTGDLAVIHTGSASGPFLKALAGKKRVIISATKSADEVFATRFGSYFVKAMAALPEADLDGDQQVSLMEGFLWAGRQVARSYEDEDRLATEHTMLEDSGDGVAVRVDQYEGLRLKLDATSTDPVATEGLLARQWVLLLNEAEAKLPETLRQRRDTLEREVAVLRLKKDQMQAESYYQQMERLFLDLAALYRTQP